MAKEIMNVDHAGGNVALVVSSYDLWFRACNRYRTKGARPALTTFGEFVAAAGIPTDITEKGDAKRVKTFLNGLGNFISKESAQFAG